MLIASVPAPEFPELSPSRAAVLASVLNEDAVGIGVTARFIVEDRGAIP
jgi:hypothetical protein